MGDFREYPIRKYALAPETPAALETKACRVTLSLELRDLTRHLLRNSPHLFVLRALLYLSEVVQETRDAFEGEV